MDMKAFVITKTDGGISETGFPRVIRSEAKATEVFFFAIKSSDPKVTNEELESHRENEYFDFGGDITITITEVDVE
jgi:hypothetical protein